jgi:uncharacterized protein (DUF169 family)
MAEKIESISCITGELERLLRLRSYPVGVKRLKDKNEVEEALKSFNGWKKFEHQPRGCQIITMARTIGWPFLLTEETLASCGFAWAIGLGSEPPEETAGNVVGTWFKTIEDAKKWRAGFYRVPGTIEGLLMAPVNLNLFMPDLIWVYGSPSQIIILINAIQWSGYERLEFSCTGESSCMDAPHQCYVTGKPSLGLPCYGERWFGGAKEEEISMAIPVEQMEKVLQGLKALHDTGYRYPIPSTSSETSTDQAMAKMYGSGKLEERQKEGKSFWD